MKLKANTDTQITLSGTMALTNLTAKQILRIKDKLTYENPEYISARKYTKYQTYSIPQYLTYFEPIPHGLRVPVGFDYTKYVDGIVKDYRTVVKCDVPEFKLTLRDDQQTAADSYLVANRPYGSVKGLVQMPTGKGKSITGLYLAAKLKQRTLVIVHKTDLVVGWRKDAELCFGEGFKCGHYGSGKRVLGDFITLATVQTLSRLEGAEFDKLKDYFGMVIVDECHHTPASTYSVINKFSARYKLGLTATPERKDGLRDIMFDFLGDFCYRYKKSKDEKDDDILPVDVYIKSPATYLDPVCKVHRSPSGACYYTIDNLLAPATYELLDDETRLSNVPYAKRPQITFAKVENIVLIDAAFAEMVITDMLKELNMGKNCIAFFKQKEHCNIYYRKLIDAGVEPEIIQIYNGDCTPKQLTECLQKAESGEARMTLTTYSKSTEGTNVKAWETCFLIGSVNDGKSAEQAVGRVRRVSQHKSDRATLYDYDLSGVYMLAQHIKTRVQRYQKLGFNFVQNSQKSRQLFGRGYK